MPSKEFTKIKTLVFNNDGKLLEEKVQWQFLEVDYTTRKVIEDIRKFADSERDSVVYVNDACTLVKI